LRNQVLFCLRPDLPALARVIVTLFPPAGAHADSSLVSLQIFVHLLADVPFFAYHFTKKLQDSPKNSAPNPLSTPDTVSFDTYCNTPQVTNCHRSVIVSSNNCRDDSRLSPYLKHCHYTLLQLLQDAGVASHAAAAAAAAAAGGALHGIPVQQKGCMWAPRVWRVLFVATHAWARSSLLVSGVGGGATVVRDVCLIDPVTGQPSMWRPFYPIYFSDSVKFCIFLPMMSGEVAALPSLWQPVVRTLLENCV
jgi:hypothetical protein